MRLIALGLLLLTLGGCVGPLVLGTAAGLLVAHHENRRDWCQWHYGNPHCWGKWQR